MNIDRFLERMKKDRNFRGFVLLALFLVIFSGLLAQRVVKHILERPVEGSMQLAMCSNEKCRNQEMRRIVDVNNPACKCGKCGEQVRITYKCDKCKYEFPYVEPEIPIKIENNNRSERMDWLTANRKCTNCGSNNINPKSFTDPTANAF